MKIEKQDNGKYVLNNYRENHIEQLAVKIGEYGAANNIDPMNVAYDLFDTHRKNMDGDTNDLIDKAIKSHLTEEYVRMMENNVKHYRMGAIYALADVKDIREKIESELQDKIVEVVNNE